MANRHLTLADGQLGSSAATLLAGENAPTVGRVDVVLQNTGDTEETVVLTFRRAGGTSRRIAQLVLQADEQGFVYGLPIQPDDTLLAVTTNASTVDYLILASGGGGLRVEILDAYGTSKGVTTLRRMLLGIEELAGGDLPDPG